MWVDPYPPQRDEGRHWRGRLEDGLEHNIRLVIAKAVLGLQAGGADHRESLRIGTQFGATYSANGWGPAMSILTCTANILPKLREEDRQRALYQGLLHVARECAGKAPRFPIDALPTGETRPEVFASWFRNFIEVRDDEGAERCLATAIEVGVSREEIASMIFAAATDHIYLDGGHVVDFANKAFELLDHLGWEMAGQVLPSLVHGMARARRSEELSQWRNPIDISSMVWEARTKLPSLLARGQKRSGSWNESDSLASQMLGDSPGEIIASINESILAGATAEQLGAAAAHAAFLRMAHFHTSNEFPRLGHGAQYSNRRPWPASGLETDSHSGAAAGRVRHCYEHLPRSIPKYASHAATRRTPGHDSHSEQLERLLEMVNVRQQVEELAKAVSDYLAGDGPTEDLLATMGRLMLREDADFHSFQIVDAAFSQFSSREGTESGRHVMIGLSRFLAAHSPTPRAEGQTYQIALRLQRGEEIYR